MTKTQHKKTAVASVFQNGISRNAKCAERDGFRRECHICGVLSPTNLIQDLVVSQHFEELCINKCTR